MIDAMASLPPMSTSPAVHAVEVEDWVVTFSGAWRGRSVTATSVRRGDQLTIGIREGNRVFATIVIAPNNTYAIRTDLLYIAIAPAQRLIEIY